MQGYGQGIENNICCCKNYSLLSVFATLLIIVDLVISPNGLKLFYGNRLILEDYLKY